MRANAGIFIIMCLLFLGGSAGAAGVPTTATVTTSPSWVIANGVSQSTITVTVYDDLSAALSGVPVNLALNNSVYGTLINASPLVTNSNGQAVSTFRTKTKSGAALITATIPGYPAVTGSGVQNIDHDIPYYDPSFPIPLFEYPAQGEVAKEVDVKISMHDQWGNPIDNRTGTDHVVTLYVNGPDPDDCGFNTGSGYDHTFSPALNGDGNLTVKVKLTSKIGSNYVHMGEIKPGIIYQTIMINAIGSGVPVFMTGTISNGGLPPADNVLTANNIDRFTLDYYLYDMYGNVMANESILIKTNLTGEQTPTLHIADANGLIRFHYGPKPDALSVNITAAAAENSTVNNTITAHFVADVGSNMVLSVTPQNLESRDVPPGDSQAFVRTTVVDDSGNPVEGEDVTFELHTDAMTGDTAWLTSAPSLDVLPDTPYKTDVYGNVIVHMTPGAFKVDSDPNFKPRASVSVPVSATWEGITKQALVTFRNYPFLDVQTSASQTSGLNLNDTVDITVAVIGNGFVEEGGGKVAAILDFDSSSSIWSNPLTAPDYVPPPYTCKVPSKCVRVDSAKAAGSAFAHAMLDPPPDPTGNWIGFNTFGNEKRNDPTLLDPQMDISLVTGRIANMSKGTNSQDFGQSVVDSINNLSWSQYKADGTLARPLDKVRAVIVLKDCGGGNIGNDQPPTSADIIALAKSTETDYTPPTIIFTVYYYDGKSPTDPNTVDNLKAIAAGTGGKYFRAESGSDLVAIFKEIATILKYAAGVQTQLTLNFQNIEVDGNVTPNMKSEVFSYVPVPPFYPLNTEGLSQDAVTSRTRIMWPNATNSAVNQSDEWEATHQLHFDIGTVNISALWNATYRLKINQTGYINLFNCTMSPSDLNYKEPYGAFKQVDFCLPDLYLRVNTPTSTAPGVLDVSNVLPNGGSFTNSVDLRWDLSYKGSQEVTEDYYYAYNPANLPGDNSNLIYRLIDTRTASGIVKNGDVNHRPPATLNLNDFYQGPYAIKVVASVPGIPSDSAYGRFTIPYPSDSGAINIQLK